MVAKSAPTPDGGQWEPSNPSLPPSPPSASLALLSSGAILCVWQCQRASPNETTSPGRGTIKAPVVVVADFFYKINEKLRWGTMKTLSHMNHARGHLAQTQAPNLFPLFPLPLVPLPETLFRPIVPLFRWWVHYLLPNPDKPFFWNIANSSNLSDGHR